MSALVPAPIGDRIRVNDRVSGSIPTTIRQAFGENFDMASHLNEHLTELAIVPFAQQWLSTP